MSSGGKSAAERRRLEMLETTPATRPQIGAIIGEFQRFGIRRRADRLTVSAALLGLDDLGSTQDLTMGQAGKLLQMLRDIRDHPELDQRVAAAKRERLARQDHARTKPLSGIMLLIASIVHAAEPK